MQPSPLCNTSTEFVPRNPRNGKKPFPISHVQLHTSLPPARNGEVFFFGGDEERQRWYRERSEVVKSMLDDGTDSLATKREGRAEQRDLHSKWCKAASSVLMLCLLCDVFIRRSKAAALAAVGPREPVKLRFHGFPSGSTIGRQHRSGPLQPVLNSVSDVGPQSGHQTSNKQQENNNFAFRRCQSSKQKAVCKRCNISFLAVLAFKVSWAGNGLRRRFWRGSWGVQMVSSLIL